MTMVHKPRRVVTINAMDANPRPRNRQGRPRKPPPVAGGAGTHMIPIKGVTPELHKRFKLAAVEAGKPYHQFLDQLLDEHESRKRRRLGQMRSPLHQPTDEDD